jgi:hypothetical protein
MGREKGPPTSAKERRIITDLRVGRYHSFFVNKVGVVVTLLASGDSSSKAGCLP